MDEVDLFMDDFDGIFDDDSPPSDRDDDASFGGGERGEANDNQEYHNQQYGPGTIPFGEVDVCSSFPMIDDDDEDACPARARSCDTELAKERTPATNEHPCEPVFEVPGMPPPTSFSGGESKDDNKASGISTPVLPAADKDTVPDPKLSDPIRSDIGDDKASVAMMPAARLPPAGSRRRSVSELTATDNNKSQKTMRNSGKHLESIICPLPPPSWHSEAADRHHRQAMILEMYVPHSLMFVAGSSSMLCFRV
jgi:hypothetical protein